LRPVELERTHRAAEDTNDVEPRPHSRPVADNRELRTRHSRVQYVIQMVANARATGQDQCPSLPRTSSRQAAQADTETRDLCAVRLRVDVRADGGQDERAMSTPGLVADGGGFSRASATARQKRESGALERGLLVRLLGRLIPVGWVTVEQWLECSVEFPAAVDTV
jgi:hypothetical protein